MPAGFRYPERALRVHSSGFPREACPCIYQIWIGKISSRSRAAFCYAWEVDVLLFASNHTPTISGAWFWFGKRGRPTFSPGLSLVSATRHHYHHHLLLTYLRGWEPSPLNARSQLQALTDWLSSRDWLELSSTRTTSPPDVTAKTPSHWPLAWCWHIHSLASKPSMQSCEIIVVLGI